LVLASHNVVKLDWFGVSISTYRCHQLQCCSKYSKTWRLPKNTNIVSLDLKGGAFVCDCHVLACSDPCWSVTTSSIETLRARAQLNAQLDVQNRSKRDEYEANLAVLTTIR